MSSLRTLLCLAVLSTASACSWMPDMPDLSAPNTSASQRDNDLYGEERTASHEPAPAAAISQAPAATPAPAVTTPPAPAPETAAPVSSADPIAERHVTK